MNKFLIIQTTQFKKNLKLMVKQKKDISKLDEIVTILANGGLLPEKNKDHVLAGDWIGYRECHIEPDWLLIYKTDKNKLILILASTGSHSDLF